MLSSAMKVRECMVTFCRCLPYTCKCQYFLHCARSVDDGSGVLSCTQWRRLEDSSDGLYIPSIGELVSMFGRVEEFRGEKQLRVSAIGTCTYTIYRADRDNSYCLEVEIYSYTLYVLRIG